MTRMKKKTYHVRLLLDESIEAIAEANKRSVPKHLEAIIEAWLAKTKKAKKP